MQFLQSALPEPISRPELLQPGIIFLLLGIEGYQFTQGGPGIIEDIAASPALDDIRIRINQVQEVTVAHTASVE
jgi:hypothetical protein